MKKINWIEGQLLKHQHGSRICSHMESFLYIYINIKIYGEVYIYVITLTHNKSM